MTNSTQQDGTQKVQVAITEEQQPSLITATASEIEAMDSLRAETIRDFSDEAIIMLKQRDLSNRLLTSRDNDQLLVPIDDIEIYEGFNPRLPSAEWDAHIEMLAQSIAANGFWSHKPIYAFIARDGRNKKIYIADGESRYRAAKLAIERGARIEALPVRIAPEGTSVEELMLQLAPSNKGREFTPLEKSFLAARLMRFGHSISKIAQNLNCSVEYVHQLLVLSSAPAKVRELVQKGEVPASMAIDVLRGPEPEKAAEVLQEAVKNAKASGKTKASPKHHPDYLRNSVIKNHATDFHACLNKLREAETFCLLDDELREEITALFSKIEEEMKPKPPKAEKPKKAGKKSAKKGAEPESKTLEGIDDLDKQFLDSSAVVANGVANTENDTDTDAADAAAADSDGGAVAHAQDAEPQSDTAPAKPAPAKKGVIAKIDANTVKPRPKKSAGK